VKGVILKTHEASALAAGKPVVIWRPLSRPLTQFPDGRWRYIMDSTERTERDMWLYSWPDPNGHRHTNRGRESCEHFRQPFPVDVPLFGKETWCEGEGPIFRVDWDRFYKPNELRGIWKSATTMPVRIARITLTLSDVRVRKPCDVTEEDVKAMGFTGGHGLIPGYAFSATPLEHWRNQWKNKPILPPKKEWNLYHFTALATPQPKEGA
jgi:hypothetical protein